MTTTPECNLQIRGRASHGLTVLRETHRHPERIGARAGQPGKRQ
ncbi:MAG: hypothetical protein P8Z67_11035 [Gammaproteobacteria bacterium]